jgi:hypothetical protein
VDSVGASGSTGTRVVTGADGELPDVGGADGKDVGANGDSTAAAGAAADGGSSGRARSAGSSVRAAARLIAAMNVPTAPLVMSSPTPIIAVRRPGTCSYAPVSASTTGRPGRAADVGACRPGRREAWQPRRLTLDDLTACLSVWGDRRVVFRARDGVRSPFHGRLLG